MNESSVCPDARLLEQFLHGRAPAEEGLCIHEHLAGCASCRRVLAAMRGAEATAGDDEGRPRASEAPTLPPAAPTAAVPRVAPKAGGEQAFPFLAPPLADDELGRLGAYRVLRVLGSGGMGVVFEAEDPKLQRRVALKVMRPAGAQQDVFRERFLREARAAARLEHDHVVPVYQVDEDRGVLFLAMPLLRGETLDDRLKREAKLPPAEVLRIGREIAEGLDAAHSHSLIHRDVKPSNVWLEAGRGRVKILDFGLARVEDDADNHLTREGLVMGTPAFMAPEQARGLPVDARCDLFSLGCVLYRLATGRNAFQGTNPFSLMLAVTTEEPPAPTALEASVPPALADLILQLLAKDPDRRPASAREVADRIAAVEEAGQATEAVPASGRVSQPPRRRRRRLVGLVVLLILLAVLAGVAWRYAPQLAGMFTGPAGPNGSAPPGDGTLIIESEDPKLEIIIRQNGAVVTPATNRRQLELKPGAYDIELADGGGAQLEPAHFEVKEGEATTVRVRPAVAAEKPGDPLTGLALTARPATIPGVRSWTVETRGCRGPVHDAACGPTGHILATAGADGSVRLWDLESGKLLRILLAHEHPVRAVAWSADGKTLAALGATGTVDLWDPDAGRLLQSIQPGPSRAVAWSPDGARLATGGEKKIHLWESQTGKQLPALEGQAGDTRAVAWSPDGKTVAGVADRLVRLWDPDKGKDPRTLPADAAAEPVSLAWSPDGKLLAVGRSDLTTQIWDIGSSDKALKTLPAAGAPDKDRPAAPGLAWASKGRTLAVIGPGGVQVWGPPFDKPMRTIDAPGTAVSWSADGKRLVAADENVGVRVWDVSAAGRSPLLTALPVCKLERVRAQYGSPDGQRVALQGAETVWLFGSATGRVAQTLRGPTREITALAWSHDGKRIAAAGGWDRQVYVWDAADGKVVKTYTSPHPDCEITALAWAPDDRTLAVGVDRPVEVPLWNVDDGKAPVVLQGKHVAAINALLWIDADTVVTGSADNSGVFWNAETGKVNRIIQPGKPGPQRPVTALALARDGKSFAAGLGRSIDHAARLFDVTSERPYQNLRGPGVANGELTWLPDGKTLAGRSEDGVLRFWDAGTGEVTRTLPPRLGLEYLLPERGFGASTSFAFSVRFWGVDDQRPETTVVLVHQNGAVQWLAVSGDGHYAAAKDLEPDVVYVVRTEAGMQTLTPKEFAAAYAWRNDPDRVGLPAAGK